VFQPPLFFFPFRTCAVSVYLHDFLQGLRYYTEKVIRCNPFLCRFCKKSAPLSIQFFRSAASNQLDPLGTVLLIQKFCRFIPESRRNSAWLFSIVHHSADAECSLSGLYCFPVGFLQMFQSLIGAADTDSSIRQLVFQKRRQILFLQHIDTSVIHIFQKDHPGIFRRLSFFFSAAHHISSLIEQSVIFLLQHPHFFRSAVCTGQQMPHLLSADLQFIFIIFLTSCKFLFQLSHDLPDLVPVHRLQQIFSHAVSQHFHRIREIIIAADCHDQGWMRQLLHSLRQFDPVHARHPDICKHHIDTLRLQHRQCFLPVFTFQNHIHRHTASLDHYPQALAYHFLIFHDQ